MELDEASWEILREKALLHYPNHREGQLKQGFFNILNEAFAYRQLVRDRFKNVNLIEEAKYSTPDIGYVDGGAQRYCEVKSLGISDEEIGRRSGGRIDGNSYFNLSAGFLRKFENAVNQGHEQIRSVGGTGLVYVFINFDDFALDYYARHRKQLIAASKSLGCENIFIRIGVLGNKRIRIT